ncbi:MAG: hypothetical protein HY617_01580, partial [Candidatus Sungbacteria bacterium]|nr:hypothetical protein [Candidatus Sungbacteria bacterium]
ITDTTANLAAHLNMQGHRILDVSKISGYLGKWSIDEEGTLMTTKVVTDEVVTKVLKAQHAIFGSAEKPEGITIYDKATSQPKCVIVENDVIKIASGACDALSPPPPAPSLQGGEAGVVAPASIAEPEPEPPVVNAVEPTPPAEPEATPEPEATSPAASEPAPETPPETTPPAVE